MCGFAQGWTILISNFYIPAALAALQYSKEESR